MNTRLVDVKNRNGNVIHTYPITLESNSQPNDAVYKVKALEAAASGQLVPDNELASLSAEMHVGRGGQLAPYGDDLDISSETKSGLEEEIRERAYFLWESDGRPEGQADTYWHRACNERTSERSHVLWEQKGSQPGQADQNWRQTQEFQKY